MALRLRWLGSTSLAIEGEGLRPDALGGSAPEASRARVPVGNSRVELGELFEIEGDGGDGHLAFEGDLRPIRNLAAGMASGRVTVRGDAGPGLGSGMRGGSIELEGSAGAWCGAELAGGLIRVRGDSGDFLGAALPGSRVGMREGVILVDGSAGEDAGLAMRRGLIAVGGSVGPGLGRGMVAGSIFGFGPVGRYPGAGMKRGTLALFGAEDPERTGLLPTFAPSGSSRPHFLTIYLRHLRSLGFDVPEAAFAGPLRRYNGDRVAGGRGEILVAARGGPGASIR